MSDIPAEVETDSAKSTIQQQRLFLRNRLSSCATVSGGLVSQQDSYRTLMTKLVAREKEKYRAGVSELEKLASGAKLARRNGTLFFVRTQKGSGKISPGDRVQFDLTESVVKGKTLRAEKGVSAVLDKSLPYLVEQALTLAGRGVKLTVYCMASDVYPLEQMPEGLLPYSLIQYQFTLAKAPWKPAADGAKKQG